MYNLKLFLWINIFALLSHKVISDDLQCYVCTDCENDFENKIETCVDTSIGTTTTNAALETTTTSFTIDEPTATTENAIATTTTTDGSTSGDGSVIITTTSLPVVTTPENEPTQSSTLITDRTNGPIESTTTSDINDQTTTSREDKTEPTENTKVHETTTRVTESTPYTTLYTTTASVDADLSTIKDGTTVSIGEENQSTPVDNYNQNSTPEETPTTTYSNTNRPTTISAEQESKPSTLNDQTITSTKSDSSIDQTTTPSSIINNEATTESIELDPFTTPQIVNVQTKPNVEPDMSTSAFDTETPTSLNKESITLLSNDYQTTKTSIDTGITTSQDLTTSSDDLMGDLLKLNIQNEPPSVQMVDQANKYGSRYAFIRTVRQAKNDVRRPRCVITSYKEQNRTVVVRGCSFVQEDDAMEHCNGLLGTEHRGNVSRCLVCDQNLCNSANKVFATLTLLITTIISLL